MYHPVDLQELGIGLQVQQHPPTLLTFDFLRYSGIIPADWELSRAPLCTPQAAQLVFQNGVSITAQGNQLSFLQPLTLHPHDSVEIDRIAQRYIQALPHAQYRSISLYLRGFVPFDQSDSGTASDYIHRVLLAPGAWLQVGNQPVQAALNFVYSLEGRQLYLSVNSVVVRRVADNEPIASLMFSGQFDYPSMQTIAQIEPVLNHWQQDLETFRDLVDRVFLQLDPSEAVAAALTLPPTLTSITSAEMPELVGLAG